MESSTPAQPGSEDWIGAFQNRVEAVALAIEERARKDNEAAVRRQEAKLDADEEKRESDIKEQRRREKAMKVRRNTLRQAWLAQSLLMDAKVPTDTWFDHTPDFSIKRLPKRLEYGPRIASVAFSGWVMRGGLLITTDLDSPLAIAVKTYPHNQEIDNTSRAVPVSGDNIFKCTPGHLYTIALREERSRRPGGTCDELGLYQLCTTKIDLVSLDPKVPEKIDELDETIFDLTSSLRRPNPPHWDMSLDEQVLGFMANLVAQKVVNPTRRENYS